MSNILRKGLYSGKKKIPHFFSKNKLEFHLRLILQENLFFSIDLPSKSC